MPVETAERTLAPIAPAPVRPRFPRVEPLWVAADCQAAVMVLLMSYWSVRFPPICGRQPQV